MIRRLALATLLSALPVADGMAENTPPSAATPAPSPNIITAESPWFLVQGEDSGETAGVARLAARVAGVLERAGFNASAIAPSKITVYINNAEAAASIRTGDRRTALILPVSRFKTPEPIAELLAAAALTRLAQAAERTPAPARHAAAAIAWEAIAPDRPGTVEHLALLSQELGPMNLEELDGTPAPDREAQFAASSFWIHRAMREAATDTRVPIAEAAIGVPLSKTLARISSHFAAGGEQAAAWWPTVHYRMTRQRTPAVETPEESRLRLASLTRIIVSEKDEDRPADNAELIARKDSPMMQEELRARLMQIKTSLPKTNPVWQNAFIARGAFFEALLEAEPNNLIALGNDAEKEAADAFVTAGEISAALNHAPAPKVDQ